MENEKYNLGEALREDLPQKKKFVDSQALELQNKSDPTREEESNRETWRKIIDILETKDLKYRSQSIESIPLTLETGVLTPLTEFLKDPFTPINIDVRKTIRATAQVRETERQSDQKSRGISFANKANVYYPEGALQYLRNSFLNPAEAQVYSQKEEEEIREVAVSELRQILNKLENDLEFRQVLRPLRDGVEKTTTSLYDAVVRPLSLADLDKKEELWQKAHDLKTGQQFREFLNNPEIWNFISRECIKSFFSDGKKDFGLWQNYGYNLRLGFVIAPEVKVKLSYSDDYPSQATLWDPRLKPNNIIGLIINPDYKGRGLTHEDKLSELNRAKFYKPKDLAIYLFKWAKRPFFLFLKENGYEIDNINELSNIESTKLKSTMGDEEYNKLDKLAQMFFAQHSPIKEGETLMTGLIRVAEKHQLPIYTTHGDLLWPENMKHKKLQHVIANKNNTPAS